MVEEVDRRLVEELPEEFVIALCHRFELGFVELGESWWVPRRRLWFMREGQELVFARNWAFVD